MKLELIKNATIQSKQLGNKQDMIESVAQILGTDKTKKIFESFDIQPSDYDTWLDVINGYAQEDGINIRSKSAFQDVAFAVLDNDPKPIDDDLKEAIVNSLWAKQKAVQSHSKVEKGLRAREEEEQLKYALRKMSGSCQEDEEEFLSGAGMEEEEGFSTPSGKKATDFKNYSEKEYRGNRYDFDDLDPRELSDYDSSSEWDSDDWDIDVDQYPEDNEREFGDEASDYDDFVDPRDRELNFNRSRVQEQEEDVSSPFTKGQLVVCKKDGATYKVEIPDGPGDMVGIMDHGRIRMVPSKDLQKQATAEESEESTSRQPVGKLSFLHSVLTGEKSQEHMKELQQRIENDGANTFMAHHAKAPRNPHPTGSYAHKSWKKGFESAAKEIWAPKKVEVDIKKKPKKK
ncbi:MAG: hypothetical protein EO766_12125 [Hydrotalea sp. AMD]|uniref:hypothetical protein n=1 Tax=Hydrotalea sp. AMD TaxID=2501297 RepID=UPI0010261822|nr:hypothetical protein [Hydrotalea sp. AMD]RWZ87265.1 MAG: hypothetical protein EO766_12125 [Hydrotalea sp. AMD]